MEQNNSLIDLKALSEPATKLIDSVSNAIGVLYEPTKMRRLAKAENDVAKIKAEGSIELQQLIESPNQRLEKQESRRQKVRLSIVRQSFDFLPQSVNQKKVNEDWIYQFFDNCQDISDKQMQILWAKILAGEVTNPGSFSLRTLDFVKTMSKEEANEFANFSNYVWFVDLPGEDAIFIKKSIGINMFISKDYQKLDFRHLESIGLIYTEEQFIVAARKIKEVPFFYGTTPFLFKHDPKVASIGNPENATITFSIHRITPVGKDLLRLRQFTPDLEYLSNMKKLFKSSLILMEKLVEG